jgi:hypothetical protein
MAYSFRYRLEGAPTPRHDGSGYVNHDIVAIQSPNGTWTPIPSYHKTFVLPAQGMIDALALPTNPQKIAAYKQLLLDNWDTQVTPPPINWTEEGMNARMTANDLEDQAATEINQFLSDIGQLPYPVDFDLP